MEEIPAKPNEKPETEAPTPVVEMTEPQKTQVPLYVGVGLMIAALLVVLLVVMERPKKASGSDASVSEMSAELEAVRSEVNRQRATLGLRPLTAPEGGGDSVDVISSRIKRDADTLVAMANTYQKLLGEKDLALDAKNSELIKSEKLRQSLSADNSTLLRENSRLQASGADGDLARKEIALIQEQKDRLAAALAEAQNELKGFAGSKSESDFADLQRRYDEAKRSADFFEKKVAELQAELAKLRIFAKSEGELLPAAVELFRTLRNLEGTKDSDNMKAYSDIGVNLGAKVLRTLDFPTGSSTLTPEDQSAIPALTEGVENGDLILVVGYASVTGNVDDNRQLSSDRATAVAQAISAVKRPEQFVQAVYIGQTNRFSSAAPERNQICEVWHIKKK
jgi:outer membrane protein OmpA-like peptidoglycan-associated protein